MIFLVSPGGSGNTMLPAVIAGLLDSSDNTEAYPHTCGA
jgi:hypothetical protein